MLTRMRFQNWRSLKDVTIDNLTPITVFIGANSSGKTNIIDALRFRRHIAKHGVVDAVYTWGEYYDLRTVGLADEPIEIGFSLRPNPESKLLSQLTSITFEGRQVPFIFGRKFLEDDVVVDEYAPLEMPLKGGIGKPEVFAILDEVAYKLHQTQEKYFGNWVQNRWQILTENFNPPATLPLSFGSADLLTIEPDARNTALILDFMSQAFPEVYKSLEHDLAWLLDHVHKIRVNRNDRETRIRIEEVSLRYGHGPTISSGTGRLIAMLAAYYALDMNQEAAIEGENLPPQFVHSVAQMPGLVVIEEPDTALNPGLLERFVEQLRNYTEGEHPRQFILTTHNPYFLNYFKPEEVQVVERGEDGYTTVKPFDAKIAARWLEKDFALGDIWTSRVVGGVPA
jgi:predicted ATPase